MCVGVLLACHGSSSPLPAQCRGNGSCWKKQQHGCQSVTHYLQPGASVLLEPMPLIEQMWKPPSARQPLLQQATHHQAPVPDPGVTSPPSLAPCHASPACTHPPRCHNRPWLQHMCSHTPQHATPGRQHTDAHGTGAGAAAASSAAARAASAPGSPPPQPPQQHQRKRHCPPAPAPAHARGRRCTRGRPAAQPQS